MRMMVVGNTKPNLIIFFVHTQLRFVLFIFFFLWQMSVLGEPEVGLLLRVRGVRGLVEGPGVVGGEQEHQGDHGHGDGEHGNLVLKGIQCTNFSFSLGIWF